MMITVSKCERLPKIKYSPNPLFGTVFTPHVLKMEIHLDGKIPNGAAIIPTPEDILPPTTAALHYGQSIFEGLKAYKQKDGSVGIFRPDLHAERFRMSARRMVMAEVPEDVFLHCVTEFVRFETENVPGEADHSLYLRPLLFAADEKIKVGTAQKYYFYVMATIAGNYFGSGGVIKPARVMVNRQFVRAYPNGLGETKTAANYAASIWPQRLAAQKECDQVLYLDAVHHDNIDEMGGMNFFAVRGKELVTPKLNGCILNGVTRRSIIELAETMGLKATEETMSFTKLREEIERGVVQETFACGTAATVHPIGEFVFQETINGPTSNIVLNAEPTISLSILKKLRAVQTGLEPAPGKWIYLSK